MSDYLRRSLDRYTEGALSALNKACRAGLKGYITVSQESNVPVFIFTGYDQKGRTRFFKKVPAPGAEHLVEPVRESEEFRAMKAKARPWMSPSSPRKVVWN